MGRSTAGAGRRWTGHRSIRHAARRGRGAGLPGVEAAPRAARQRSGLRPARRLQGRRHSGPRERALAGHLQEAQPPHVQHAVEVSQVCARARRHVGRRGLHAALPWRLHRGVRTRRRDPRQEGMMPFKKVGSNDYTSPSGRHYNSAQVRLWYAGGGKFPGEKGAGEMAKGSGPKQASYAKGGEVLGRSKDFIKTPDRFRDSQFKKKTEDDFGKIGGKDIAPAAKDKSLKAVKPKG